MTDFIPLFPLKMVVFPGEKLNLHIFEPRYKQLIRQCEENRTTFGIPAFLDEKVMRIGTEIRLLKIEKVYPKGEMDVKTEGIGVFKIEKLYRDVPDKLYSGADIERIDSQTESDPYLARKILMDLKELFEVLNIKKEIPKNDQDFLTYQVAHNVGFTIEQEYELLTMENEIDRQNFMSEHLTRLIPMVREMERLREKIKLNGHFKNVIPPNF